MGAVPSSAGGSSASSGLIDHQIGEAYDDVQTVADNIEEVKKAANADTATMAAYADEASTGAATATTKATEASASAAAAQASEDAAAISATNAAASEASAGTHDTNAAASATAAAASATDADGSATAAASSAAAADASKTAAANSATAADGSATAAATSKTGADASAAAAATSEANAATSEANATNAAAGAAASETNAATSEANAAVSATAAATSETNAANSANAAATSETNAAQSAADAAANAAKSVLNGSGPPAAGLGDDGNFYIDTLNDDIYGPKTAGAWGAPTSLIGPEGPEGPPGQDGAGLTTGDKGDVNVVSDTDWDVQSASGDFEVQGDVIDITGTPAGAGVVRHTGGLGGSLVLENLGGTHGDVRLELLNENGANGAIFENVSLDLVDFIFKGPGGQKNIRFEQRAGFASNGQAWEFQFGTAGSPSVSIGNLGLFSDGNAVWHEGNFDPTTKSDVGHGHVIADISNLQDELDSKLTVTETSPGWLTAGVVAGFQVEGSVGGNGNAYLQADEAVGRVGWGSSDGLIYGSIGAQAASGRTYFYTSTGIEFNFTPYVNNDKILTEADKGVANGIAPLGADQKIASAYLPSFVDDVVEVADYASLPGTGETGKIYVTLDLGEIYRWSGSAYVEISPSPGTTDDVPEGATNLYHTTSRAAAAAPVQSVAGKTGAISLVKGDVGLGNVDNTSDANKPISAATQTALDGKKAKNPSVQTAGSNSITPTFSDDMVIRTGATGAITLNNPTGTAVDGWGIVIRLKDNGTARAISFGTQYRAIGATLPTTTTVSKTLYIGMIYNAADTKWDVLSVQEEA